MSVSRELREKLAKRLSLQSDGPAAPCSADSEGVRARSASTPALQQEDSPRRQAQEATPHIRMAERLQEQVSSTLQQRDEALEQRKRIDDEDIAKTAELSSEVTKLRMDVEMLRRDLQSARMEVGELRASQHLAEHRDRVAMEQAVHADLELALAQARAQQLAAEVAGSAAERAALQGQVLELEEQVAAHVVRRVRLEAQLRQSGVEEAQLRRIAEAADATKRSMKNDSVVSFTMSMCDEDDEQGGPRSRLGTVEDAGELERLYEGLELSAVMPLDRVMELTLQGAPQECEPACAPRSWTAPAGEPPAAGPPAGSWRVMTELEQGKAELPGRCPAASPLQSELLADEDFQAPLHALEVSLRRIRGGARSGDAKDAMGQAGVDVTAGTGEAVDDLNAWGEPLNQLHLNQLQRVLTELGSLAGVNPGSITGAGTGPPDRPMQPKAQAPLPRACEPAGQLAELAEQLAEEQLVLPGELAALQEQRSVPPVAPPEPTEALPALPGACAELHAVPPGVQPATSKERGAPPEALAVLPEPAPPAHLFGFKLLSPYVRLGQKYASLVE